MKPLFPTLTKRKFEVLPLHHAEAIIRHDMPVVATDIDAVFGGLEIAVEELVRGGGGESSMTQRLRRALSDRGWQKRKIEVKKLVDGREVAAITHEIDHVKAIGDYVAALEIEWNNKDPFFDRDLENLKRLHSDGAMSLGVIVTRATSLHDAMQEKIESFAKRRRIKSFEGLDAFEYRPTKRQKEMIEKSASAASVSFAAAWANHFVSDKFGEATTHWRKLMDRVKRGVGNPCPLLLIGIPDTVLTD